MSKEPAVIVVHPKRQVLPSRPLNLDVKQHPLLPAILQRDFEEHIHEARRILVVGNMQHIAQLFVQEHRLLRQICDGVERRQKTFQKLPPESLD